MNARAFGFLYLTAVAVAMIGWLWMPAVGQAWPGTSLPVRQARPAQASPGASSVGRGLLPLMTIQTENIRALMAARP
jgi:hypothetical protein